MVKVFEREQVEAIYSTDLTRTKSTVQPLADKLKKPIHSYHPYKLDINQFLEKHKGQTVLVVGHSNTTNHFVNTLIGKEQYPEMAASNFSSLFVVYYLEKGKAWASELTYSYQ